MYEDVVKNDSTPLTPGVTSPPDSGEPLHESMLTRNRLENLLKSDNDQKSLRRLKLTDFSVSWFQQVWVLISR